MKAEQISVFIENKSGRLAEIARLLGKAGINIRALSLASHPRRWPICCWKNWRGGTICRLCCL